jgi:hypothetical protein
LVSNRRTCRKAGGEAVEANGEAFIGKNVDAEYDAEPFFALQELALKYL